MYFRHEKGAGSLVEQVVSSDSFDLAGALAVCMALVRSLQQVHGRSELHQAFSPCHIEMNEEGLFELRTDANVPLSHASPEQTGRMNRGVDFRSDYYSLGVVFYELMTGQLPFEADNVMELVHSHIAKQPVPPGKFNPQVQGALEDIILKLLAKNAEDRYQ